MTMPRPPIVITGMGAVSALGHGTAALWAAIAEGRDGLRPVERFALEGMRPSPAGVTGWSPEPTGPDDQRFRALTVEFAVAAAKEAVAQAALDGVPADRIGLVVGTSVQGDDLGLQEQSEKMAARLGVRGPCLAVATVCCASTAAVGVARDLLASGAVDVVLAGGAEAITPELYGGFNALGLLSAEKCAPFSRRFGTNLGEGAGFVVLEAADRAAARGAKALAALLGYGLSADAFHATGPDPTGSGIARCLTAALTDAGVAPAEVGYVKAHGTATQANDAAEARGIATALGGLALPISSLKGHLGHAQSAAGILELIAAVLALRAQQVPPTLHLDSPRVGAPPDPVAGTTPRPHAYEIALCASAAMAGANAAAVIGRTPRPAPSKVRRPVRVLGLGAITPAGRGFDFLEAKSGFASARVREADCQSPSLRAIDPEALDPSARLLTVAVAGALEDAGVRMSRALAPKVGVILGNNRLSPATLREFRGSIAQRGLAKLSGPAFARRLLSAPAGACAQALSLKGPTSTLCAGAASGLSAILFAAELMATREELEVLVAAGLDEEAPGFEGAGAIALGSARRGQRAAPTGASPLAASPGTPSGPSGDLAAGVTAGRARGEHSIRAGEPAPLTPVAEPGVLATGWAWAGPDQLAIAIERALSMAGTPGGAIELCFGARPPAPWSDRHLDDPRLTSEGAGSALAAGAAVWSLRRRNAKTALVLAVSGGVSAALVLQSEEE